jgi:hypothetical protein
VVIGDFELNTKLGYLSVVVIAEEVCGEMIDGYDLEYSKFVK